MKRKRQINSPDDSEEEREQSVSDFLDQDEISSAIDSSFDEYEDFEIN